MMMPGDNSRNAFLTVQILRPGRSGSLIDRTFSQGRASVGRRPLVHPREGWQGHGLPRRRFLKGCAGLSALAALGAGGALTGCASDLTGSGAPAVAPPS